MAERATGDPGARIDAGQGVPVRYLDADGQVHGDLPEFARDRAEVVRLYQAILLTRAFDEKAVALQRTGRLGTFASSVGQEAVGVGLASAMQAEDVLVPSFREQGAQLWRGVTMEELLLFWGGDERGSDYAGPRRDFPVCIPVATHALHAVGAALALKLHGEAHAAVCVIGDGATSRGDFYEAMNLAGVWHLPVVFVVVNNQWAISVPRKQQTAAATLAQKAVAAGIEGLQVDGNDVFAVRQCVAAALAHAARGPTLIEALSYRLGDHTTADDASRYRDDDEVSRHWQYDPVVRLRLYLENRFQWRREDEESVLESARERAETAARHYLEIPPQAPTAMFDHLYAHLPAALAAERDALASAPTAEPADDD